MKQVTINVPSTKEDVKAIAKRVLTTTLDGVAVGLIAAGTGVSKLSKLVKLNKSEKE